MLAALESECTSSKALADPTRRLLLDRLRQRNGQTLGELCEHLEMAG